MTTSGYKTQTLDSLEFAKLVFTTIPPEYELFYKWISKNVRSGAPWIRDLLIARKNNITIVRKQFSTPFPIPHKYREAYQWLLENKPRSTTEDPRVLQEKVDKFFEHGYEPQYAEFFRWLYKVRHDDDGFERRGVVFEFVSTIKYDEIQTTPFPVPKVYRAYFAFVNALERTIQSTDHHYWLTTTPLENTTEYSL